MNILICLVRCILRGIRGLGRFVCTTYDIGIGQLKNWPITTNDCLYSVLYLLIVSSHSCFDNDCALIVI